MLLGVFALPTAASADTATLNDELGTESGPTTALGGGDHFFVVFGSDAAFGIVWGTEETPNNVYFVTIKARYIGMAQVYDTEGKLVDDNRTMKVYTLYAVKLDDMLEFDDENGNGTLQYYRQYAAGNFTGYVSQEPIFKKVDLKTAWDASPVVEEDDGDVRSWSFDLTATDLPYQPLEDYTGPSGDDKLNNLTLTFHLETKMVQVDNASLPQWRITVNKGPLGMTWIVDADKLEDIQVTGDVITYHVKWDQSIEGWDYDAADEDPALLMEFEALVGNYIPPGMAAWMQMRMFQYMNEFGYANGVTDHGEVNLDNRTGTYSTPKPLASPRLTFGGDYTRIGKLEWVTDVTVDGEELQLHAQIMAGIPVWGINARGGVFAGFAVLGGIAFPGGDLIVHDPTFSSEALVNVDGLDPSRLLGLAVLVAAVLAVVVVVAAVALVLMGKKPGQKSPQAYERTMGSQPGEWAKYYNKK
ncbi:MAG: hypothetical protein A3K67_01465 [Euryarchaeota archaeon RBG_16_62_10]|nr:MAG: hypothetical protein A3K67_01465 [Euryarchaeota archaeon RBG_16_62_10]